MTADRGKLLGIFFAFAVLALTADLTSKAWAFAMVERQGGSIVIFENYLQLDRAFNNAAMWSMGRQFGLAANYVLAGFSSVVALGIIIWGTLLLRADQLGLAGILGVVLGGALGNLHDRIFFPGVRDFLTCHYKDVYYWPTFNLADSFLVCGAVFLFLTSFWPKPIQPPPQPCSPTAPGSDNAA